ncbi:MAG TPA: glycosyltransferase family 4 protein, partial [Gemmatimonadaceae bacterium]|nr:glycosyltransferase family 4 protein [Gemmatimonadaceae bacterium]
LVGFAVSSLLLALRVRNVDVVMGTSPSIFQAASAWFIAAVRRKPFLLEIRDLWPEFFIDMRKLRNPVAIWLARRLERFLYRRADRILVNSPAYVGYLLEQGIPRDDISLIPNGVDPTFFADVSEGDRSAERERLHVSDDTFVAMYAGVMGPANDLETLLRAAELLQDRPDIRVVLVGDGKSRRGLETLARERSLANVVFAGSRPKSGMARTLAAADTCVATLQNIAMFRMTYPNKVFDYLAAGRPVVLAIDGVIREVVERAHAGIFVTPGDADALARAIAGLAADRAAARQMGARGAVFVREHFNRAAHGAAFADLVEDVATSG